MTGAGEDRGRQVERTYLSWQRTIALLLVIALLALGSPGILRGAPGPGPLLGAAVICASAVGLLVLDLRRRWHRGPWRAAAPGSGGPLPAPLGRPWGVAVTSGAVCVLAAAVMLGSLVG